MPAAIVNQAGQITKLTRGKPVNLGTLTAANTAVAFTVPEPTYWSQGLVIIQVPGTAGTTATLEISIDGGVTFLPLAITTLTVGTPLTGDTACTAFYQFNCGGMGSGALFKFGYSGAGVPNTAVWALVG